IEVINRTRSGQVRRRRSGGVDDEVGLDVAEKSGDAGAVADIELRVREAFRDRLKPPQVPGGVALRPEEVGAHVVVDADDLPSARIEITHGFGADQSARAGDEDSVHAEAARPVGSRLSESM